MIYHCDSGHFFFPLLPSAIIKGIYTEPPLIIAIVYIGIYIAISSSSCDLPMETVLPGAYKNLSCAINDLLVPNILANKLSCASFALRGWYTGITL